MKKIIFSTGLALVLAVLLNLSFFGMPVPYVRSAENVLTVKKDGTGNYTTIQACADAVQPGQTCLVYPGTYSEYVITKTSGTSESQRVVFKTSGIATVQGFSIRHSYVTVEGFDVTGYAQQYSGSFDIRSGGVNCKILNNTIRDGSLNVQGMLFDRASKNCVVSGNTLRSLRYMFMTTQGEGHVIEDNVFEKLNSMDYLRVFGRNHVFRRNVFREGNAISGVGNHPDFVQTFGNYNAESINMLFEANWIQDLEGQMGQLNSQIDLAPSTPAVLSDTIRDWVFKNNVFINISGNMNVGMPGVKFINNTFYRMSYDLSGIGYAGTLKRGDASYGELKNNVFLAGGSTPDPYGYRGHYGLGGAHLSKEVLATINGTTALGDAIFSDLVSNAYINTNGVLQDKAKAVADISQLAVGAPFEQYKVQIYDLFSRTVQLDARIRSTFSADYNYIAEAPPAYAAKATHCDNPNYLGVNFCEAHGVNGGDPLFQNVSNPLGPDGQPFTLDDGLKPRAGSLLCGKGSGGKDIGVYSCSPSVVFADPTSGSFSPSPLPPPSVSPSPTPAPAPTPQPSPAPSPSSGGGGSAKPAPTASTSRHPRGTLINHNGTVYFLGAEIRYPFPSAEVFFSWGCRFEDVVPANSGDIAMPVGPVVEYKTQVAARHPRGTLINHNGTIYFLGAEIRYPFPSAEVFLSWGASFQDVVPANTGDIAMPVGPVVQMKR